MSLPQFQDDNRAFQLMQNAWATAINPFLRNPANQSLILKNIPLKTGSNVVNTLLGRTLQGWSVVRQRASASIWDSQDTNQTPQLTLVLNTSADVTIDLEVF